MRVGLGYDSHMFMPDIRFVLGGVEIPYHRGLLGHSDGDALAHAVIDALLGAMGEGNIGVLFPDTDPKYKGANSLQLLNEVVRIAHSKGYKIISMDSTILAEEPKLNPFVNKMKENLARSLGTDAVSIKPKTNEGMGWVGKGEGIATMAICLMEKQ
jgi:2-C-methyl-D-erythritol 2,4-cyclodiphosphate synthase